MLPLWVRVDLGAMTMKGYSTLQNWSQTNRFFIVISRTLVGGEGSYLLAEMQSVYSTAPPTGLCCTVANVLDYNIVVSKFKLQLCNYKNRSSTGSDISKGSQRTGGHMLLLSGIQEMRNHHSEDLHDDQKKLLSDFGPHGEEGQVQEQNGNALWPVMWKISNGLVDEGIRERFLFACANNYEFKGINIWILSMVWYYGPF